MAEQRETPMTREDINMQWAFTFLQEMRQDLRDLSRRVDEMGHRVDTVNSQVHQRIDDLSHRMDQRFNRQTATMLAIAGAIIAAVKL